MNKRQRLANFWAMVKSQLGGNCYYEEMDGSLQTWQDLSDTGKLAYISVDAARCDVPFEAFAKAVRRTISDREGAALRLVQSTQRELYLLGEILPDSSGTESTPLIDRLRDALDREGARITETPELERD